MYTFDLKPHNHYHLIVVIILAVIWSDVDFKSFTFVMYKLKVDDDELSELSRDFGWKEDITKFIFIVMCGKTSREANDM